MIVPANVVSPSAHTITLPPLPTEVADALIVVAASISTVVAFGIAFASSAACGIDATAQ